jgi:hypothetical protein
MTLTGRQRVDGNGRAYAGSQRQIQTYVNELPEALSAAVIQSLGADFPANEKVRWVSPIAAEHYVEYLDTDFLHALGFPQHGEALRRFWPKGGPCWDALARIEITCC